MGSIYSTEAFTERVNYAAQRISANKPSTRAFDTCFETGDADYVVTALYRRSLKNKRLADNIFTYLSRESVLESVERLKNIPTKDLKKSALVFLEGK